MFWPSKIDTASSVHFFLKSLSSKKKKNIIAVNSHKTVHKKIIRKTIYLTKLRNTICPTLLKYDNFFQFVHNETSLKVSFATLILNQGVSQALFDDVICHFPYPFEFPN